MRSHGHSGFTLIEVLLMLLVISVGLFGVIGLIIYGSRLASKAQGEYLAMATAITVATDAQPRLDPAVVGDWVSTAYANFDDDHATQTRSTTGFINGLYVKRVETSAPADVIAKSVVTNQVTLRSALVEVTVYESISGNMLTSYATRIIRQRETP